MDKEIRSKDRGMVKLDVTPVPQQSKQTVETRSFQEVSRPNIATNTQQILCICALKLSSGVSLIYSEFIKF